MVLCINWTQRLNSRPQTSSVWSETDPDHSVSVQIQLKLVSDLKVTLTSSLLPSCCYPASSSAPWLDSWSSSCCGSAFWCGFRWPSSDPAGRLWGRSSWLCVPGGGSGCGRCVWGERGMWYTPAGRTAALMTSQWHHKTTNNNSTVSSGNATKLYGWWVSGKISKNLNQCFIHELMLKGKKWFLQQKEKICSMWKL